jgi:hypothetical protein
MEEYRRASDPGLIRTLKWDSEILQRLNRAREVIGFHVKGDVLDSNFGVEFLDRVAVRQLSEAKVTAASSHQPRSREFLNEFETEHVVVPLRGFRTVANRHRNMVKPRYIADRHQFPLQLTATSLLTLEVRSREFRRESKAGQSESWEVAESTGKGSCL